MDLTQILDSARSGNEDARNQLVQAAYEDLRKIATARMRNQSMDHTLTATALVNEVSLKMLNESRLNVASSSEFLAYASTAMRHLLIDHARTKGRQKRGGDRKKFSFDEAIVACDTQSEDFLALNSALEELAAVKPRNAKVVEMRYYGGMSNQEVADALGISLATVKRDWVVAKSWLMTALADESGEDPTV